MKKNLYQKPKLTKKKVRISFFMTGSRFFDSFDELLAPNVFAQSCGGSGGCGSGSNEFTPV